jgi:septal ring factor EnvC (AmiA/AmiB activator)
MATAKSKTTQTNDLDEMAAKYARLRVETRETRDALKELVNEEYQTGRHSEVSLAIRAGVDRLTLRAWIGKHRGARLV